MSAGLRHQVPGMPRSPREIQIAPADRSA